MGLRSSPQYLPKSYGGCTTCTWIIVEVLSHLYGRYFGNFDSHLAHLRNVFESLSDTGLKLRPDKCKFAVRKIHYLGHVVSKDSISPSPIRLLPAYSVTTGILSRDIRQLQAPGISCVRKELFLVEPHTVK